MPRVSNGRTKRYIKATSPDAPQRDPRPVWLMKGRGKVYAPNGGREVARRRRQIAGGQLRVDNGLRAATR